MVSFIGQYYLVTSMFEIPIRDLCSLCVSTIYVCMNVCMYVFMHCVKDYNTYIHTYIHTYMYTYKDNYEPFSVFRFSVDSNLH